MAKPNRDPERLIAAIREMHRRYPDLRVGQIIANAMIVGGWQNDPFYIENDELASLIEKELKE